MRGLLGRALQATDGDIGSLRSFYFDDRHWMIRYLLAGAGGWLHRKLIVIAPGSFRQPVPGMKDFPVNLTREQIGKSPEVDLNLSSPRNEELLSRYYGWPMYGGGMAPEQRQAPGGAAVARKMMYKLYSMTDVFGYGLRATGGAAGTVRDFVVDDGSWDIRYLVIGTGNLLPGKKTLVSPRWLEGIDERAREMRIPLARAIIKGGPAYDPAKPPSRDYEAQLFHYYGKQEYGK